MAHFSILLAAPYRLALMYNLTGPSITCSLGVENQKKEMKMSVEECDCANILLIRKHNLLFMCLPR